MRRVGRSRDKITPRSAEESGQHESMTFAVEQSWRTLEHTGQSIDRADAKAAAILAASGGVGAILYGLADERAATSGWIASALIVSAVSIVASALCAGLTLRPRRDRASIPSSLVYFDHIARALDLSVNEYLTRATGRFSDPEALYRDLATQIWVTGKVAAAKYAWVDRAMTFLLIGLLATGITALSLR
jgi:hypothetical protein